MAAIRQDSPDFPDNPLTAELKDLVTCMCFMKSRPLKMIAEQVRPEFDESQWKDPVWAFSLSGSTVTDRKLLPFPTDSFQFSVANGRTRQTFHVHRQLVEIYVSSSRMKVTFRKGEKEVIGGVIVIPPNVAHKMEFSGVTFVFQAAVGGLTVHEDKTVVEQE